MTAPVARAAVPAWVRGAVLGALWGIAFWGCAGDPERQWQKFNQPYTEAEFKRDKAECTRGGKLDVACMRARGWVDVTPDFPAPAPSEPPKRPLPGPGY